MIVDGLLPMGLPAPSFVAGRFEVVAQRRICSLPELSNPVDDLLALRHRICPMASSLRASAWRYQANAGGTPGYLPRDIAFPCGQSCTPNATTARPPA